MQRPGFWVVLGIGGVPMPQRAGYSRRARPFMRRPVCGRGAVGAVLAGAILLYAASDVRAQVSNLPDAIQRGLAEINPRYQSDIRTYIPKTFALFSPLLESAPKDGVVVTTDVAYGPDPKQRLDVYAPRSAPPKAPVVVFVHGGALTAGDKNASGPMYANVSYYFARHGFLGVNANYRLAPQSVFPGGARDVGAVVDWIQRNAARLSANPDRIFLVGHSSGGTHAATWAYDRSIHGAGGPGVEGVVLLSARLRADNRKDDPNALGVDAYFGTDPSLYAARSPLTVGGASLLPTFIAVAEFDNPFLDVYGAELFAAQCQARGRCGRFLRLTGHNHISMAASLNTADDRLGSAIREFIASVP